MKPLQIAINELREVESFVGYHRYDRLRQFLSGRFTRKDIVHYLRGNFELTLIIRGWSLDFAQASADREESRYRMIAKHLMALR